MTPQHRLGATVAIPELAGDERPSDGRLLARWLQLVRGHPIAVHLVVALLIAAAIEAVLLGSHPSRPTLPEMLGIELVVALGSLSVPMLLTAAALRGQFRTIFELVSSTPTAATPVVLRFVSEELRDLAKRFDALRAHGRVLESEAVTEWVRLHCFDATSGRYISTDVSLPSVFMNRYRDYLNAHAQYAARTQRSIRVTLADEDALAADLLANAAAYQAFVDWHDDHGVQLLYLDRDRAWKLTERHGVGADVDLTVWLGELALTWAYEADDIRVRMGFMDEPLYRRSLDYLRDVLAEAQPFPRP